MSRILSTYTRPPLAAQLVARAAKCTSPRQVLGLARVLRWKRFAGASEKTKRRWRDILARRISEILIQEADQKAGKETHHAQAPN